MRAPVAALMVASLLVTTGGATAAPAPLDLAPERLEPLLVEHARDFFPEERATAAPAVLAPRLGLPAVVTPASPFEVQLLEWEGAPAFALRLVSHRTDRTAPLAAGCEGVALRTVTRQPLRDVTSAGPGARVQSVRLTLQPEAPLQPGSHDLLVCTAAATVRHPRAVWVRSADLASLERLKVIHLSDLHVGHRNAGALAALIADVNGRTPDLVVVTGDLVEQGQDPAQWRRARALLLQVEAPLALILGNHDHGLSPRAIFSALDLRGWSAFSRHFHPQLFFTLPFGRWDLVGFDSGASVLSARILTRGLSPVSLARLDDQLRRSHREGRGVLLLSHAPARARLLTARSPAARGLTGRMDRGAAALEQLLLEAAGRGQTVLHLAGHTHFADAFVARPAAGGKLRFELASPRDALAELTLPSGPGPGLAALLTAQSASKSGFRLRQSGAGHGFSQLELGPRVHVRYVRFADRR